MLQTDAPITLSAGQYRLREQLAGSAYGLVWRAAPVSGGPDVAIKLVNREQMARAHPGLQSRWSESAAREIAFLRSLEPWDERHIVRLLDSGAHEGLPAMALELLGPDLGRHVASERNAGRPVEFSQVLDWLGQVNQALARVHQYGWRHLDLKPANLLLVEGASGVKLADFGTSELLGGAPARNYTGTANWQAPEQFFPTSAQTWDTDARTDYFALGAMLYYLVTGGLPLRFCRDCGQAYREHQARGPEALLARHHGAIPATLRDDEAALFTHRIERQLLAGDATWHPSGDSGAATLSLALLRALLAPARGDRPQHAVQISRMLEGIRAALPAHSPVRVQTLRPSISLVPHGAARGRR